jgi:hypothetical protein
MERLDVINFSRGETRLNLRRTADSGFLLTLNNHPPSRIAADELQDLAYWLTRFLKENGLCPRSMVV